MDGTLALSYDVTDEIFSGCAEVLDCILLVQYVSKLVRKAEIVVLFADVFIYMQWSGSDGVIRYTWGGHRDIHDRYDRPSWYRGNQGTVFR